MVLRVVCTPESGPLSNPCYGNDVALYVTHTHTHTGLTEDTDEGIGQQVAVLVGGIALVDGTVAWLHQVEEDGVPHHLTAGDGERTWGAMTMSISQSVSKSAGQSVCPFGTRVGAVIEPLPVKETLLRT